jgi:hypothetical protein
VGVPRKGNRRRAAGRALWATGEAGWDRGKAAVKLGHNSLAGHRQHFGAFGDKETPCRVLAGGSKTKLFPKLPEGSRDLEGSQSRKNTSVWDPGRGHGGGLSPDLNQHKGGPGGSRGRRGGWKA